MHHGNQTRTDLFTRLSFGGGGCGGGDCSSNFACNGGITTVVGLAGGAIGATVMGPTGAGAVAGGFYGAALGAFVGHHAENAICGAPDPASMM